MGNEVSSEAHAESPQIASGGSQAGPRPGASRMFRARVLRSPLQAGLMRGLTRALFHHVAGTVPTCLRWPHGGKTAYICGARQTALPCVRRCLQED